MGTFWFLLGNVLAARNLSKVSLRFNKIANSLTLPGLGFFENLKFKGVGAAASRPMVKKHAVSQKIDKFHFCHHLMTSP